MTELRKSCSRRLAHLCLWTTLLGMPCALADEHGIDVGASLALRSDSLFRGVSQTLGSAAVEGSVDVAFESGFYAYAWASNVDFEPDSEPDDGARLEVDVALGYTHDLNDRWAVDVELVRYIYPGTVAGANYDYNELLACLWLDERYHATVGYSEHVFGMDAAGLYYALGVDYELPADISLALQYGYYDLDDAYSASYSHASVGISRPFGPISLTLAFHDTFGDAQEIFYTRSVGSRFDLSIDIGLFR